MLPRVFRAATQDWVDAIPKLCWRAGEHTIQSGDSPRSLAGATRGELSIMMLPLTFGGVGCREGSSARYDQETPSPYPSLSRTYYRVLPDIENHYCDAVTRYAVQAPRGSMGPPHTEGSYPRPEIARGQR